MSIRTNGFAALQKVGKALMLPVSVLPVAGILLGVGAAKFHWLPVIVSQVMETAGNSVFSHMGLLFAIGVALGFAKNDGVAALAATVGYFIMIDVINIVAPGTDVGVLGGILAGAIAAWAFNRFFKLELPAYLGFFAGKRSVPIITGFCSVALGVLLSFIWPPIGNLIQRFSMWAAYQNPELAFSIYGVVERMLLPFGLHHIWNTPFFFEAGNCLNSAGEVAHGVVTCYLSADDATRAAGNGFGQLAGGYMFKMFGLPAAALAIWHTAKPENRAKVGGVMISAAITSFLTGITEPIEFSFMFVAPILYAIHAVLAASAYFVMNTFNVVHGTSFSHGFIDYVVLFSKSEKGFLIPIFGLAYAAVYYVVFRVTISVLNLKTPGREEEVASVQQAEGDDSRVSGLITAFGGGHNILVLDNCITRLRIEVRDVNAVDKEAIKGFGATAVLVMGQGVQAIFGMEAEILRTKMEEYLQRNSQVGQPLPQTQKNIESDKGGVRAAQPKGDFTALAGELLNHLGGKDNIVEVLACASSRLRLEVKSMDNVDEVELKNAGVAQIMKINDRVIHLLMGDKAAGTEQAILAII